MFLLYETGLRDWLPFLPVVVQYSVLSCQFSDHPITRQLRTENWQLRTRRVSDAATFRRTAAVVRNRRGITDRTHFNSRSRQGADRGLATGTRTADVDFDGANAVIARHVGGVHCGLLRSKRRAFTRTAEAQRSRTLPGQNVSVGVRDGDDGVVERRLDVRHPKGNVLALPALELLALAFFLRRAGTRRCCCWFPASPWELRWS